MLSFTTFYSFLVLTFIFLFCFFFGGGGSFHWSFLFNESVSLLRIDLVFYVCSSPNLMCVGIKKQDGMTVNVFILHRILEDPRTTRTIYIYIIQNHHIWRKSSFRLTKILELIRLTNYIFYGWNKLIPRIKMILDFNVHIFCSVINVLIS